MKNHVFRLLAVLVITASAGFAQAINVTSTGVDIGATTSTTAGSLLQQSGQTTTFWSKDGVNAPSLLVKIQGDGKVGIGTATPGEKLAVNGNTTTTGSATVGSLVVGSSTIFSVGSFESAPQTIPGTNNTLTVAHNLGGIPKFTTISLRCNTAEFGWAVNDEILLNSVHMRSDNTGLTAGVNATSFKLQQLGNIYIHRIDTNAIGNATSPKWSLIFRAWR